MARLLVFFKFQEVPWARSLQFYCLRWRTKHETILGWISDTGWVCKGMAVGPEESTHTRPGRNLWSAADVGEKAQSVSTSAHYQTVIRSSWLRLQNTGTGHDPSCVFSTLMPHTGLKGYASNVVRINNEGTMSIRLGIGMTEKDPPEKSEVPSLPQIQRPEGGQGFNDPLRTSEFVVDWSRS